MSFEEFEAYVNLSNLEILYMPDIVMINPYPKNLKKAFLEIENSSKSVISFYDSIGYIYYEMNDRRDTEACYYHHQMLSFYIKAKEYISNNKCYRDYIHNYHLSKLYL